jgi:dipeptide transport system substrate-binding protein
MTTLQRYSSNSLTLIFTLSMSLYLSFLMTDSLQAATKTFVFCSESSPSQFNPQLATDGTSFTAGSRQIFNRLVEFKTGQTSVSPGLAESWTVSKDQDCLHSPKLK